MPSSSGSELSDFDEALLPPVPPPPRAPSPLAKRLVFAYTGSQRVMLYLGIIFTVMCAPFAIGFGFSLPGLIALDLSAHSVPGTVISAGIDEHVEINDEHPVRVRFSYVVDGQRFEESSVSMDDSLASLQPGSTVNVDVSNWSPKYARLAGADYSVFGYLSLFTLIFPVVGLLILRAAVRSNRREIRAYTHGQPAFARITFFGEDSSTSVNDRHPTKLAWSFEANGRSFTGSITSMERGDLEPYAQGGKVVVLYDPARPGINTLYVD